MGNREDMMETYGSIIDDGEFHNKISRDSMKSTVVKERFSTIEDLIINYTI
jgi:hypothetical protein